MDGSAAIPCKADPPTAKFMLPGSCPLLPRDEKERLTAKPCTNAPSQAMLGVARLRHIAGQRLHVLLIPRAFRVDSAQQCKVSRAVATLGNCQGLCGSRRRHNGDERLLVQLILVAHVIDLML